MLEIFFSLFYKSNFYVSKKEYKILDWVLNIFLLKKLKLDENLMKKKSPK